MSVGVLLYQDEHYRMEQYLEPFLQSLSAQSYKNLEIMLLDNGSPDKAFLKIITAVGAADLRHLQIVTSDKNLGFGGGHNTLIHQSSAPYYLVLNPDMWLHPELVQTLMSTMQEKPDAGMVTGKILRWDFQQYELSQKQNPNGPGAFDPSGLELGLTDFIDTVGLGLTKAHRFYNIGEGKKDDGQYDEVKAVFGASGTCMLLNRSALNDIQFEQEYFDEDIFMYKEDIDLSYRLQWTGYKCYVHPEAKAYHNRSVATHSRKSQRVQSWSYLHEKMLLFKNWDARYSFIVRFRTGLRQWLKQVYASFFAHHLLEAEEKFQKLLPVLQAKREKIVKKVAPDIMQSYMS